INRNRFNPRRSAVAAARKNVCFLDQVAAGQLINGGTGRVVLGVRDKNGDRLQHNTPKHASATGLAKSFIIYTSKSTKAPENMFGKCEQHSGIAITVYPILTSQ